MKKIGVALLGLGTVGGGTYRILKANHDQIMKNDGVDVELRHIIEKDIKKAEALGADLSIVGCDIDKVVNDDKVQIVLNGVNVTNTNFPVIYVKTADKVFVTASADSALSVTATTRAPRDFTNCCARTVLEE